MNTSQAPGPHGVLGAQAQITLKRSHRFRIATQCCCVKGEELSFFLADPQELTELLCVPLEQAKFTFGK